MNPARTHFSTRRAHLMRMLLGLSEALPSLVDAKFKAAKASQALIFSPTELAIVRTSAGVPVGCYGPRCLHQLTHMAVPATLLPGSREEARTS